MKRVRARINIHNLPWDEKENAFFKPYIHITQIALMGSRSSANRLESDSQFLRALIKTLSKQALCAIMPPVCNSRSSSPITIIITTMTISASLGEALLVKK